MDSSEGNKLHLSGFLDAEIRYLDGELNLRRKSDFKKSGPNKKPFTILLVGLDCPIHRKLANRLRTHWLVIEAETEFEALSQISLKSTALVIIRSPWKEEERFIKKIKESNPGQPVRVFQAGLLAHENIITEVQTFLENGNGTNSTR